MDVPVAAGTGITMVCATHGMLLGMSHYSCLGMDVLMTRCSYGVE